ncbi:hypothetical protein PVK06_008168 [Gossypium arboreum]|uniref:DUF4283 domain-containing protein n=1 Tax=Gossypium arboreum TaxID=29729 RepID=A0ABR0QK50_GOSAR|nr:hypothetical protein PVK06_008168 [Gossypium arboreum]
MMESGGEEGFGRDEISLLAELIQLSVKSLMVEPNDKPTLICTIWTEKSYNPDSFRAWMKSIWKTKKKFEIKLAEQNLFLIMFESDEDLETIMEGNTEENHGKHPQEKESTDMSPGKQDITRLIEVEDAKKRQKDGIIVDDKDTRNNYTIEDMLKPIRKSSWKRIESTKERSTSKEKSKLRKRKSAEVEVGDCGIEGIWEDTTKKMRYGGQVLENDAGIYLLVENSNQKDRRLPKGKPTEYNENNMLECPWTRESTSSEKALVFSEATKPLNGLLYGD